MEKYPEFIEQLRRDSGNPSMARIDDRTSAIQKPGFGDRIPQITLDIQRRNPVYFSERGAIAPQFCLGEPDFPNFYWRMLLYYLGIISNLSANHILIID